MKRYVSAVYKGLLLLVLLISIFGNPAFDERAIAEGFVQMFFEAKEYHEIAYFMSMPILLVVGLIIEFVVYSKKKRILGSFVYSGYLSLVVIVGVSYWFLLSLEDGLAVFGVLGMSMTAFAFISIIQLGTLYIYRFIKNKNA